MTPARFCYVNGEIVLAEKAKVSIFDRGFLFADGVYEVSTVLGGKLVDNAAHLARLRRSLAELDMPSPADDATIVAAQRSLIIRNKLTEGIIYLQVTRGSAERDFAYPKEPKTTLVMFTQAKTLIDDPVAKRGISVISVPDIRWGRRDIKTIGLLAACMAKQEAKNVGADDAWLVENGVVTEGSSNNAFIVTADGTIVTRQLGTQILHGITRKAVLALCDEKGHSIEERAFSIEEAKAAKEAFVTSASTFVWPVISIDGTKIGSGIPGTVSTQLREHYIDFARKTAE